MKSEKASKIARVILSIIVCFIVYVFAAALVNALFNSNPITGVDPNNNSLRNASISMCEKEAKSTNSGLSDIQITNYCKCAIAKFEQKHPDIWTNPSIEERINRDGFTKEETDLFAGCVPTT